MSNFTWLQATYPRTWKVRRALNSYNLHKQWEGEEPTTVTVHETYQRYGGPHEGGWFYIQGYPIQTICIFNKKQAVKAYVEYSDEYEVWDQPDLGLTSTYSNYDINFSNDYARFYPTERPRYE